MEDHNRTPVERIFAAKAQQERHVAAIDQQAADLGAEERSEDDGMAEHAHKASDPARWAAEAPLRSRPRHGRVD